MAAMFAFSLLGASFLSGYELLRYFTYYGMWGTLGLLATIYLLLQLGLVFTGILRREQISHLHELLVWLTGPVMAPTVTFLLYLGVFLYAGTAISQQLSGLTTGGVWLSALAAVLCFVVVSWLMRSGWPNLVTLSLAAVIAGLIGCLLLYAPQQVLILPSFKYQLQSAWLWQAVVYFGLHLVLMMIFLFPLTNAASSERRLRNSIWAGGAMFAVITLLTHFSILKYWHDVHDQTFPVMQIAAQLFPGAEFVYTFISLAISLLFAACALSILGSSLAEQLDVYVPSVWLLFSLIVAVIAFCMTMTRSLDWLAYTGTAIVGMICLVLLLLKRA